MNSAYLLFGVRSPLVVEYEETLRSLGRSPVASLSVRAGTFINAAAVVGGATFIGAHTLINRAVLYILVTHFLSTNPGCLR